MRFVFTPDWFLGKDILIDAFSFIVLAIFFYLCFRYYKISNKKNFLYLGGGFFLIALSQLAKIITKTVLYYDNSLTCGIGKAAVSSGMVKSVDIFYYLGFFFNNLLMLLGLYIIYRLPAKKKRTEDFVIASYFIILSAVFSAEVTYLFHLTCFFFLILIMRNCYNTYIENESRNTLILLIAFSILAASQMLFIFSMNQGIFVVADLIELVSYITLLFLIIRILRDKKKYDEREKKKQKRYNF